MTPLPSVPGVLKLTLDWIIDTDSAAQTITHWAYSGGPPSTSQCVTLAADFASAFGTACSGSFVADHAVSAETVLDLSSSSGAAGTSPTHIAGTHSGTALTNGVNAVILHEIAQRYRGGRPKNWLPFGSQTDLANNSTWIGASASGFAAAWNSFRTGALAITVGGVSITNQVAVSYYSGYNTPVVQPSGRVKQSLKLRPGGPVIYIVQSHTCPVKLGSMRRRVV